MSDTRAHVCDFCGNPATHCYREGSGTGHSEHVCACKDHAEDPLDNLAAALKRMGNRS